MVDAVTVITTHLGELIRRHAWELLGRAEIKRLMDALNDTHPKLMEELVPKLLTLGEVGRVLEQLLRERVSIRDLGAILEALLETAPVNKSIWSRWSRPRARPWAAGWSGRCSTPTASFRCCCSTPASKKRSSPRSGARGRPAPARRRPPLPATPLVRRLTDSVRQLIGSASSAALPVLLCPSPARYHVKRWLEPVLPRLAVVAAGEIPPEIRLAPGGHSALSRLQAGRS